MNKSHILDLIGAAGMNLYNASVMGPDGCAERTFQPSNNCNNSFSVTKAFTMTAIGMLQDDGLLTVSDPVTRFFPDWEKTPGADPAWAEVTVEHALLHRIGFADGFLDMDDDDPDFISHSAGMDYLPLLWQQKIAHKPGTRYAYSDTAYYLLSRIISAAAGENEDEFLRKRLMLPLNFGSVAWSRCPMGYPMGATGLFIHSRDTVKLGRLYLDGGVYNGQRIVSEGWIRQALNRGYELNPLENTRMIGKRGMCGQIVLIDPVSNLSISWYGHSPSSSDADLIRRLTVEL